MRLGKFEEEALKIIVDQYTKSGNTNYSIIINSDILPDYITDRVKILSANLKQAGLLSESYFYIDGSWDISLMPEALEYFEERDAWVAANMPDALPHNAEKLLQEILEADNAIQLLGERFAGCTQKEDDELRGILKELKDKGFINTMWADDVPYHLQILNPGKTYFERKNKYKIAASNSKAATSGVVRMDKNSVFIVHGRDNAAKSETARFLERLSLRAVILNEQPGKGNTIIEKIEKNSDVGFAIILYTPCDEGKLKGQSVDLQERARQNVVFEHGYFCAKIGRDHVAALVKGAVETPSDISGIEYINMDDNGAWQYQVARELKAAGYDIDMNKLA